MKCSKCEHWITSKATIYEDGTIKNTFTPPEGKGECTVLKQFTDPDFGCNKFEPNSQHIEYSHKKGAPWQNWVMGDCPDCEGRGCHMVEMRPACRRCGGLGKVRHYDDGYIADTTWDHPKEKELKKRKIDPGLVGTILAPVKKNDSIVEGDSV